MGIAEAKASWPPLSPKSNRSSSSPMAPSYVSLRRGVSVGTELAASALGGGETSLAAAGAG
eukprot:13869607-Alexandrium_andersonii.AAC.1